MNPRRSRDGGQRRKGVASFAYGLTLAMLCPLGCEGSRVRVADHPPFAYPCDGERGTLIGEGVLRSGPTMREQGVVERFAVRQKDCGLVVNMSQEWALGTADAEAVFSSEGVPLVVWKRTTMPTAKSRVGHVDTRRFDLRARPIRLWRRSPVGRLERYTLRGRRPQALIGPGRGLLSAWIRSAGLDEGERVRAPVFDVREPVEVVRDVTLARLKDRRVRGLGKVRVYTIFGREPVFTDQRGIVVGDMFGMRRATAVKGPVPDPMPDPGPMDPSAPL